MYFNSDTSVLFCPRFNFDHIKPICIVQKHVDKTSEGQHAVKKVWEESENNCRQDSNLGAQLGREGSESNRPSGQQYTHGFHALSRTFVPITRR